MPSIEPVLVLCANRTMTLGSRTEGLEPLSGSLEEVLRDLVAGEAVISLLRLVFGSDSGKRKSVSNTANCLALSLEAPLEVF